MDIANLILAFLAAIFSAWALYFMYFIDVPKIIILAGERAGTHTTNGIVIEAGYQFFIVNNGRKALTIDKFIVIFENGQRSPKLTKDRIEDNDKIIGTTKLEQPSKIIEAYLIDTHGKRHTMSKVEIDKANIQIENCFK
ncbi:hypothetical protein EV210_105154 [Anaerospora hongkongensis]|uniref:Uncharacterized protein n=1 Tax=Anaerospora hongkongensis TaxID=244830 RepID=A0A4R1PZJ4_9FIRM|nr:hypothetical protein [Anaerospora hongkongensis]TCL37720.1 hypothetical protein EV210_105154 [Anaerospora hongkongensis]